MYIILTDEFYTFDFYHVKKSKTNLCKNCSNQILVSNCYYQAICVVEIVFIDKWVTKRMCFEKNLVK